MELSPVLRLKGAERPVISCQAAFTLALSANSLNLWSSRRLEMGFTRALCSVCLRLPLRKSCGVPHTRRGPQVDQFRRTCRTKPTESHSQRGRDRGGSSHLVTRLAKVVVGARRAFQPASSNQSTAAPYQSQGLELQLALLQAE